jgi:hypothetical protein
MFPASSSAASFTPLRASALTRRSRRQSGGGQRHRRTRQLDPVLAQCDAEPLRAPPQGRVPFEYVPPVPPPREIESRIVGLPVDPLALDEPDEIHLEHTPGDVQPQ